MDQAPVDSSGSAHRPHASRAPRTRAGLELATASSIRLRYHKAQLPQPSRCPIRRSKKYLQPVCPLRNTLQIRCVSSLQALREDSASASLMKSGAPPNLKFLRSARAARQSGISNSTSWPVASLSLVGSSPAIGETQFSVDRDWRHLPRRPDSPSIRPIDPGDQIPGPEGVFFVAGAGQKATTAATLGSRLLPSPEWRAIIAHHRRGCRQGALVPTRLCTRASAIVQPVCAVSVVPLALVCGVGSEINVPPCPSPVIVKSPAA